MSGKIGKKATSEIESLIKLCLNVQSGNINPFDVDVDYILSVIQKHYPNISNLQELCLDAQALKELSTVLEYQNQWIQHQSTTLYKDPFFLSQQLINMDLGSIVKAFLKSWHPILEIEQISEKTLTNSMGYWSGLLPLEERWREPDNPLIDAENTSLNDALKMGLVMDTGFTQLLEDFWHELGEEAGPGGKISYWNWVGREDYEETVRRAYLTCFLVSYGYANVDYDRINEKIFLIHKINLDQIKTDKISLPLMVDYEEWKEHMGGA